MFSVPELIVALLVIGVPVGIIYLIRRSRRKAGEEPAEALPLASDVKRLLNLVVDLIVLWVAVNALLVPFVNTDFVQSLTANRALDLLFTCSLSVLYYVFFETVLQRTPAKFLTGTKVVMLDGSKPDAATILKRSLSRLVPFEPFSGYKGKWWHDQWTKTRVVKA